MATVAGAAVLALVPATAAMARSGGRLEKLPPAPMSEAVDPEAGPATAIAQDKVNYDEVGYANIDGPDRAGVPLSGGEAFNPDGVSAAHATLPIPSFAEVTNLQTGRTILVRVNDRAPVANGRIVSLSPGAARQLGVETDGLIPVRVRRTNPPEHERNALRAGGAAAERLETPPALLNALRKRLGPAPGPVKVAAAAPVARPAPRPAAAARPAPAVAKPAPRPAPPPVPRAAPGANYGDEAPPQPVRDGRFIEEEVQPHWRVGQSRQAPPARGPAPPPRVEAATAPQSGTWYVQVAAFSSEARARAAASRVGGSVVRAGSVYRVRTGPYASEAAARGTLGALAAKGYRGARPTR